jgi:hypothetical protein
MLRQKFRDPFLARRLGGTTARDTRFYFIGLRVMMKEPGDRQEIARKDSAVLRVHAALEG